MKNSNIAVDDVAKAMGKTKSQFLALHPALVTLGFPVLESSKSNMDVNFLLEWAIHQQESNFAVVTTLAATQSVEFVLSIGF